MHQHDPACAPVSVGSQYHHQGQAQTQPYAIICDLAVRSRRSIQDGEDAKGIAEAIDEVYANLPKVLCRHEYGIELTEDTQILNVRFTYDNKAPIEALLGVVSEFHLRW